MGWEYSDTDCEQPSCSGYPFCTAKSEKDCEHYLRRKETLKEKIERWNRIVKLAEENKKIKE